MWCAILGLNQYTQFADTMYFTSVYGILPALTSNSTAGTKRKQEEMSVLWSGHIQVMT